MTAGKYAAHLILPGLLDERIWKTLRAVARYLAEISSRPVSSKSFIEEYDRAIIKKRISAFLLSNQIDLFDFSKLRTDHLFGYEAIARLARPCFLDLHDDAIEHERVNRELTARLIRSRHIWWGRPSRHSWSGIWLVGDLRI
jgi:hypothetical protein